MGELGLAWGGGGSFLTFLTFDFGTWNQTQEARGTLGGRILGKPDPHEGRHILPMSLFGTQ